MNKIYLGIGDLVANAFIEANRSDKIVNRISIKSIEDYGREICEILKEKYPETSAVLMLSRDDTTYFFENYSLFFERDGDYVVLKTADFKFLEDRFRDYKHFDFIRASSSLSDKLIKQNVSDNQEIIYVTLADFIANIFIEINSLGRDNIIYELPLSFIQEYVERFIQEFNKKYIPKNIKLILESGSFIENYGNVALENISLDELVGNYRKDLSITFVREIKNDGLNINDMYDNYILKENIGPKLKLEK